MGKHRGIASGQVKRKRVQVKGAVQGVGFRPFIYRIANEEQVTGWVINDVSGCLIEVEGPSDSLKRFLSRMEQEAPPHARILMIETADADALGEREFVIKTSDGAGEKTALMLPDLALCDDCRRELFDPSDRRYRYPFINCTNCGPRFSIINGLPYDRANTTMERFVMCGACRAEYENPADRRFHAQPNACTHCGPQVAYWDEAGRETDLREDAIQQCICALREGRTVAVKGLGGFHLMVDARNEDAVQRLRARKRREQKPLAVMAPSLQSIQEFCFVSIEESELLRSCESPIVLLKKRETNHLAPSLAPGNPCLGVMLPYTPLHALLLHDFAAPLVATSGNLTDEPICTDEREAVERLRGIADSFLIHNRPVTRYVDDSVVRVVAGRTMFLRRARGYAPLPVPCAESTKTVIALGAHLKNTVALNRNGQAFLSQHIGDLETPSAHEAFYEIAGTFQRVYELQPDEAACDLHPDYLSSRYAHGFNLPVTQVQHHYAHAAACMAEHGLDGPALALSWDGTGLGTDGTIWGGEYLLCDWSGFHRAAHLRTFPLPSGDAAVKEPRRAALGLLYELWGETAFEHHELACVQSFNENELRTLKQMLCKNLNCPRTSSLGRLFDGFSSLMGLRQSVSFEGQGAMELEWAMGDLQTNEAFSFEVQEQGPAAWMAPDGALLQGREPLPAYQINWGPMIEAALQHKRDGVSVAEIAARFHNTIIETALAVAQRVGVQPIVLTGGCFQNAYLSERVAQRLQQAGFTVYQHQQLPPNDGGLSYGQLAIALRRS
ncbi:carbamoyltransferase HypF [bacterium]|nr:carbamoyltransferase HypF [bacterium]